MVLLRLTVKVFPREQLRQPSTKDRAADDDVARPATTFLIVVWRPEEVTLGKLAYMIQEKWKRLKPDAAPLEIRKLVDDKHEEDTLDAELTVADVFVDSGKALADGLDQRGAIRVIQQPGRPERYGSVLQDWAAVANNYARAPPPLFSDPPRNERRPTTPKFSRGPVPGPSHAAQHPGSDYAVPSTESGEERSNRQDNHTHASPILIEDSQKSRDFASYTCKNPDLPNDELPTSTEIRPGSFLLTREEQIGYGGTIMDALRYNYAKQEAAMHDMDRQVSIGARLTPARTLAPDACLSNPKLRSTSSTNNLKVIGAKKRQVDIDDIYAIPSTGQESKNANKPQSTKRQRRTISRSDELRQHNLETSLVSPGNEANNAIVLDSDIGEDKPTSQVQGDDKNMAIDHQSSVRRGTRKSSIRGPGRKSMAVKLSLTSAENTKTSTQETAATKIQLKKQTPVTIADSDIEIVEGPEPPQASKGGQGSGHPPGGNRDEANRNSEYATNSTNKSSTPMSGTYQLTHLDAKTSKPIYSDIVDSDISDDDAGAIASGERNEPRTAPHETTPQKTVCAPVDTRHTSGDDSMPKSPTQNGIGALGLSLDRESNSRRPSHSSPSRPLGPQESGFGVPMRRGMSTTPAFPRPRPSSQVPTEHRGSVLESEKSGSSEAHGASLLPALRSAQKSSPRTVSTRRSVSFLDDPKVDQQSTPASASSVKVGNTMYPAGVTPEWVEWMRTDGELQKKIDEGRLQGKSENYCECVGEVKHFAAKLYHAKVSKIGYRINKYERDLKRAKKILQNHPEEGHPAESQPAVSHGGKDRRPEEESGETNNNDMGASNESQSKSQGQGRTGLSNSSQEDSRDLRKLRTGNSPDGSGSKSSMASPSPNMPSTPGLALPVSSPSAKDNAPSVKHAEEKKALADEHGLKRKAPKSESGDALNGAEHPLSGCGTHPSEPELGPKEMNAHMLDQDRSGKPEQRNGKTPVRDGNTHMSSSDSSSSGSDSDSESDSNLMASKGRNGKSPALPPPGGSARRALITPFRDLKKNWPQTDNWLSDGVSPAENTRISDTVGFETPSFSQPAPSTRQSNPHTNGGFHPRGRATLKTLIQSQKGSEDESSAKNTSENESLQGGKAPYTGFNILRRAGFM
ncbi:hypothetical protein AJ78_02752 [Emergomyces pasteurianus Ep9510]|uniref:Nucleolar protein Dnt1-like N-terminal domain-containing protein n=1 Tax=Emergomyces pasteurianus Ep9510 TaxID=1447872 RepID=A0A1J9QMJ6_9EURO|nr:hypothetical protein AJ78_02752 [Emergomyces pasteurianus Ep9510]